ncbi:MAG: MtaA/CmuA family methyltransferase [Thermaerobacter sp.]|nr:MtaA/CmuA family methyltransferase [Thermaerobacter sp.]
MATATKTARERVMALFARERQTPVPVFSGMGNVTVYGLEDAGIGFAQVHGDAEAMARAAASSYERFGYEAVVVPFDLGVEAEAMGRTLNTYASSDGILYPTVQNKLPATADNFQVPADLERRGRIPLVAQAIRLVKERLGEQVAVGSYVLGPFTLAGQVLELDQLLKLAGKDQTQMHVILERAGEVAAREAEAYRAAGADFVTVREMGAASDILSPRMFRNLIQPHLKEVFAQVGGPTVLHICGSTQNIVEMMADCGATAVSVDQKNDLAASRATLGPDKLLFGNLDPYKVLVQGTPEQVREAVRNCVAAGADAVWPGCDIWPTVPAENMQAMMDASREQA